MNTLDELERLLKAGTKGPWETKQNKAGNTTIGPVGYSGFITPWVCDDENAALIVAAINALPGLLESAKRVERLEAALRLFLEDERFHVSVGGNPIAIEQMIGQARAALKGT